MIYLDYNATTPVLPEVLEAMMPYFTTEWGNPSMEVIFASCAPESNNTAIHAALKATPGKRHIITSAVEHSSVLNYCMALKKNGYRVTYLPVDREGLLKIADLEDTMTDEIAIVSLDALRAS